MAQVYTFTDSNGEIRLMAEINPAPGGSQPVTCQLVASSVDVKSMAQHPALWDSLFDNPWDTNPLAAIPAGLGLSFVFNGTDATITTTAAGTWALSLFVAITVSDTNSLRATLQDSMASSLTMPPSQGTGTEATLAPVYTLPAGASFNPLIETNVAGDGLNTILANFNLVIVRLA